MSGWVKTYRKLSEWEWYKDSHMVHLFTHLIIKANHEDRTWRGMIIKRGQLVTSRRILSTQTGISERTIRTCLERLQSTHEIAIKSTQRNSIITICNYDIYQEKEEEPDPQNDPQTRRKSTHNRPSIKQELKEDKNNIIDTNVSTSNSRSNSTRHDDIDYEKLINFFNSKTNGVFGNVRYPISEKRRGMIRARIREYGKEAFAEMINLAVNSNFLKGDNKSGFRASLDWMIKPNNFQKIIEGNYNNSVTHNDRLLTYDQVLLMVQKGEATFDRYEKVQGRDGKMHYKRKDLVL